MRPVLGLLHPNPKHTYVHVSPLPVHFRPTLTLTLTTTTTTTTMAGPSLPDRPGHRCRDHDSVDGGGAYGRVARENIAGRL